MTDVKTWLPAGLFDERDPIVAERLVRLMERTGGRRAAPQRIVAHLVEGTDRAEAEGFLADHPAWRARLRLPGLYELHARPDDVTLLADHANLFSWLDAAGRVTGPVLTDPKKAATCKIAVLGGKAATVASKVKSLGGSVAEAKGAEVRAKLPGRAFAELLKLDAVEAVDIEAVQ